MSADHAASVSLDDAPGNATDFNTPLVTEALSLRTNFSWMFVANVIYAGSQWAMLTVLAKLGTPVMVGQFVLALAVTTPLMALFMLQLRVIQATDARREYHFGDYLALRLAMVLPALVSVVAIVMFFGYRRETAIVVVAVAVSAVIDSISDIIYGLLQRHERMDRIAQSTILKATLSLAAFSVTFFVSRSVVLGIVAIAVARTVVLLVCDLPNAARVLGRHRSDSNSADRGRQSLRPRWRLKTMAALANLAWPMGLVMMLIVVSGSIPRYYVEQYMDEYSLGIFGAIGYFSLVGIMVVRALGEAVTWQMAEHFAKHETRSFVVLLAKLSAVGAVLGVSGVLVALVAGRFFLTLLYGPEYAEHNGILVWTMIAAAISYIGWFVGHGVTAARLFRVQIPLNALVVGMAMLVCWWLVPRYGLLGAAWSLSITAVTQLVGAGLILAYVTLRQSNQRCAI